MKEVNLSKSAWHVKFFMWATGNSVKWNNLCPYFWALVSLLLISPLILLWKTVKMVFKGVVNVVKFINVLINKLPKSKYVGVSKPKKFKKPKTIEEIIKKEKRIDVVKSIGLWSGRIFLGCYVLFILFLIILLFIKAFTIYGAFMTFVYMFALIGLVAFIILIVYLLGCYFQSDTHEMVVGMFRAKKQKYCPHINWRE